MPANEPMYIGGVMRCCSEELSDERSRDPNMPTVGDTFVCPHCDSTLEWTEDRPSGPGWAWVREETP